MSKRYLTIFKDDCCGCHSCEVACKQEHNLDVGPRLIRIIDKSPLFVPIYCHHCADAPCKRACPVDAIIRNSQGIVLINEDICIGCRECIMACPFGAMQFHGEKEVALKCDLCLERLTQGEIPACASVCPTGCILWGDIKTTLDKAAQP
ncbi:MAG: 4Fe-4S binding protein [Syntrophorhabdaceae bacterium]|nr:4Fe-4S binding protein [Syntrophorhabdaceae bacterium]